MFFFDFETLPADPSEEELDDCNQQISDINKEADRLYHLLHSEAGFDELRKLAKTGNLKDPEKIQNKVSNFLSDFALNAKVKSEKVRAEFEKKNRKTSLNTMKCTGFIFAFAFDDSEAKAFVNKNGDLVGELELFKEINELGKNIKEYDEVCGHNIKCFDLPILHHRLVKYGLNFDWVPFTRYDKRIIDTQEIWAGSDWSNKTSLKDICNYLQIQAKMELDGSMVVDEFKMGGLTKLVEYAKSDVIATREVARRLNIYRPPPSNDVLCEYLEAL